MQNLKQLERHLPDLSVAKTRLEQAREERLGRIKHRETHQRERKIFKPRDVAVVLMTLGAMDPVRTNAKRALSEALSPETQAEEQREVSPDTASPSMELGRCPISPNQDLQTPLNSSDDTTHIATRCAPLAELGAKRPRLEVVCGRRRHSSDLFNSDYEADSRNALSISEESSDEEPQDTSFRLDYGFNTAWYPNSSEHTRRVSDRVCRGAFEGGPKIGLARSAKYTQLAHKEQATSHHLSNLPPVPDGANDIECIGNTSASNQVCQVARLTTNNFDDHFTQMASPPEACPSAIAQRFPWAVTDPGNWLALFNPNPARFIVLDETASATERLRSCHTEVIMPVWFGLDWIIGVINRIKQVIEVHDPCQSSDRRQHAFSVLSRVAASLPCHADICLAKPFILVPSEPAEALDATYKYMGARVWAMLFMLRYCDDASALPAEIPWLQASAFESSLLQGEAAGLTMTTCVLRVDGVPSCPTLDSTMRNTDVDLNLVVNVRKLASLIETIAERYVEAFRKSLQIWRQQLTMIRSGCEITLRCIQAQLAKLNERNDALARLQKQIADEHGGSIILVDEELQQRRLQLVKIAESMQEMQSRVSRDTHGKEGEGWAHEAAEIARPTILERLRSTIL